MNNKDRVTQYKRILAALRKAGKAGMTTMELALAAGSNCVWKRCAEMGSWHWIGKFLYYIDRTWRLINGKRVRVYKLVRWQA